MAVNVMGHVWEDSRHDGGALLVLLALADFSDKFGVSWPSVKTLAERARLSESQVYRVLGELQTSGELTVESGAGEHRTNRYTITLASMRPSQNATPRTDANATLASMRPHPSLEPSLGNKTTMISSSSSDGSDGSSGSPPTSPRPNDSLVLRALEKNYARLFRDVTPMVLETLKSWAEAHPYADPVVITDAFRAAEMNGVRKWTYIEKVLESRLAEAPAPPPVKFNAPSLARQYRHLCGPLCKNGCITKEAV